MLSNKFRRENEIEELANRCDETKKTLNIKVEEILKILSNMELSSRTKINEPTNKETNPS